MCVRGTPAERAVGHTWYFLLRSGRGCCFAGGLVREEVGCVDELDELLPVDVVLDGGVERCDGGECRGSGRDGRHGLLPGRTVGPRLEKGRECRGSIVGRRRGVDELCLSAKERDHG